MPDKSIPFTVRGRDSLCGFSHVVGTPAEAIAKAQEMIEDGLKDLTVTTHDGRIYNEDDFAHLINRG
jgi:hypothetical protein